MDWPIGGVVAASAAVVTVAVAQFGKWRVNCWFCNGNQWVHIKDRRQFTCNCCGQYNGFNKDGGYDKDIREQHRIVPSRIRYASTEQWQSTVSDDSPFCSHCEASMEKKRITIADWEPDNEDNWKAEYDDYNRRMERIYALCERCEMATQRRLTSNRQRYKYLETWRNQLMNGKAGSILSGLTSVSRMAVRTVRPTSRRRFFSGGSLTTKLHLTGMIIAGILMMTLTDTLLCDCGMNALPLPHQLRWILPIILSHAFHLSALAGSSHALSFFFNKNRISLPDIVAIPFLIWLACSLTLPIEGENAIQSVAASSSLFLLLTAVAILPRKRLHKKKPNRILNSAFSVASTPMSQVSSQADSFLLPSPRDDNWSPLRRGGMEREGEKTTPIFTHNRFNRFREQTVMNTPDEMEWEESVASSPISPHPSKREYSVFSQKKAPPSAIPSHINRNRSPLSSINGMGGGWRERRREETPDRSTPSREIASQLSAFSMRDENDPDDGIIRRRSGPFPSSSSHFGVASMRGERSGGLFGQSTQKAHSAVSFQSRTPSIRSLARSNTMIPPAMARFHPRSSPSAAPSISHSHLTSASQQVQESSGFYYLILILTFTSVCTFIGMSILFYHTFFR